ncbi:hypothetical protein PV327_003595 [Microctonus hyperodae]|uniref:Non-canonical purine NTP phosphatase/PRRC1 domain-containing protein n=1 Tax=Microctonus hyperodae TaxID=165561 RepID=A0AA39L1C7_MICHY|nr:hypothetical protein PV327_003595 [Microctonus hyperodae]
MTDESNGESTFEFVDKRVEELAISNDTTKTDSMSGLPTSVSLLTPLSGSTSTGNLLPSIAPPSALPSFVANPSKQLLNTNSPKKEVVHQHQNTQNNEPITEDPSTSGIQTKQPQPQSQLPTPSTSSSKNDEFSQSLYENQSLYDAGGIVGGALFSWVKDTVVNSNMLNKVAEKAKSSVNSMITTLDPQMREFIYSGGDIEIIVASNKEFKISPIREAFQGVFGKATVTGVNVDTSAIAIQPVGFAAGMNGAELRIKNARSAFDIPKDVPVIGVQNFVLEVGEDKWYELAVLILEDPKNRVSVQTFTQMTPVPSQIVAMAQESTPDDYPLKSMGLAVSIASLMATNLQVSVSEWHHTLTSVSRRDVILLAAQSLAGIYKNTITVV